MGKTLFNSTIKEKQYIKERLELSDDSTHPDIHVASMVVEDALLLHDLYKTLEKVKSCVTHAQGNISGPYNSTTNAYAYLQQAVREFDLFETLNATRKRRNSKK